MRTYSVKLWLRQSGTVTLHEVVWRLNEIPNTSWEAVRILWEGCGLGGDIRLDTRLGGSYLFKGGDVVGIKVWNPQDIE